MNKESPNTAISRARLVGIVAAAWIVAIGVSLAWNWRQLGDSALHFAIAEARASFNKDLVYRRWAALQGGVYVPPTDKTPPNPYLSHIADRDLVTTKGKRLTLVNPAYMTSQVHALARELYGVQGHITSLAPLNPKNGADPWETKALQSFEKGVGEVVSTEMLEGQAYLRLMRPLVAEPPCLKCHAVQGYKEGEIRGGISVSVPFAPYAAAVREERIRLTLAHLLLGGLGLLGLWKGNALLRRTEAVLSISEARHRNILQMAPDGFWLVDMEGRLLEVNESYCRMSGYSEQELLTMTVADLEAAGPAGEMAAHFAGVKDRGEDRFESCHRRRDGSVFWVEVCVRSHHDEGEAGGRLISFQRDITERRQAEEALRKSEAKYRDYLENAPYGVFVADDTGCILQANPSACQMSGYTGQELLAMHLPDLHAEDSVEQGKRFFQMVIREGRGQEVMTFRTRSGKTRWWSVSAVRLSATQCLGFCADITERKRAEAALQRSIQTSYDLVQAIPSGVCIYQYIPPDRLLLLNVNPGAERLAGIVPDQAIGKEFNELWPEAERLGITGRYLEVMRTGRMFETDDLEYKDDRLAGAYRVRAFVLPGERLAVAFEDITERKRAEEEREKLREQLMQSQKLESVGRLAGGVAHDFNNMLGVILGYVEMAIDKLDPDQPISGDLLEIRAAARHSAELTRQLLAFARRQTAVPKILALNDTIAGMLKMLRRLIGEGIELAWRPGAGLWPVRMDPTQIDQILVNLCVNARDAIDSNGRIAIATGNVAFSGQDAGLHGGGLAGEFVQLVLRDNGSGMDEELRRQIFEPFFTTKDPGEGTGLGLATVYGIVRQNNGFVDVDSAPGRGTTFRIYLPRYAGEGVAAIAPEPGEIPRGRGETVLLVEDEPAVLNMGRRMLAGLGYEVLAADSPAEALRLAGEHPEEIGLLITDIIMPGMNGRELAEGIGEIKPGLPCLFVSGYTADVIAHHGVLDDKVHFIQKPFSKKELAVKVREALEGRFAGCE